MKLIFVSSGPYPEGGASTNRHLAYAKGLVELGHTVEFILLEKQSWSDNEIWIHGVRFKCVATMVTNKSSKIEKLKAFSGTIRKAKQSILESHQEGNIKVLILLDTSSIILIPFLKLGNELGIKVLHERTEYPFVVCDRSFIGRINLFIYLRFVIKKFDGIYVINNALKKYFSSITKGRIPVTIVNMIVDPSRFEIVNNRVGEESKIITYCGKLDGDKDGVPILIEAFSMISNEFPLLKLRVIGSISDDVSRRSLLSQINKYGLEDKVILTGSLKRDEIPELLCNSDILALARPNNSQAEGGFPTKLGEYLATGNPVVVTNVGELSLFLKDKFNAFIAEPDDAEKFADKLKEALLAKNARTVGQEGKKLVYNEFNYLKQAMILEEMFSQI
jgi:glycosyltransferase involved in cell wall biosynthesis